MKFVETAASVCPVSRCHSPRPCGPACYIPNHRNRQRCEIGQDNPLDVLERGRKCAGQCRKGNVGDAGANPYEMLLKAAGFSYKKIADGQRVWAR